jgi:hypothetical protein
MIKAFLERRRIRKTFERYLSPEVARQIADGSLQPPATANTERSIEFVFVAISAPDATAYSEHVSILTQLVAEHGGIVHTLVPVAVFAFGGISSASPGSRPAFVAAVQCRFADAAIVHGSITAHVGSFGSNESWGVGFWWPGVLDALRQLTALSPGDTHELANEGNS